MAAELEDWSEGKSRRIRRREKLLLAISIFCFKPVLSCLPTGQYPPNIGKGSFAAVLIQNGNFVPKPVSPSFYVSYWSVMVGTHVLIIICFFVLGGVQPGGQGV